MKIKISIASILLFSSLANASWQDLAKGVMDEITTSKDTKTVEKQEQNLSESTMISGLKQALEIAVNYSTKTLSQKDGYLNNALAKIPLPNNLDKAEGIIRKAGGDKIVDDLIKSMNNAASNAAIKTTDIFLKSINNLTIDDAKNIVAGKENALTSYFKTSSYEDLKKSITPIVKESIKSNQVASYYDTFNSFYQTNAKEYVQNTQIMSLAKNFNLDSYLPLNDTKTLDEYITNKAIDGLFKMIEEKEKAIRENPVEQTTSLLKKIFG